MKKATLRKFMMVPAVLFALITAVSVAPAAEEPSGDWICHGIGWPDCVGVFDVAGAEIAYEMKGLPTLATVEKFKEPSKARNVAWKNLELKGETEAGDTMTATLDTRRTSSGTVLSLGNKEFPATATMRFYLKMEIGGMTLVSDRPAVVQGIVHSVPPSVGDVLTMIGGPVDFHQEGAPGVRVGSLKKSAVTFNGPVKSR